MGKIKSDKINYVIPGGAISQQEFEHMIEKAEKGPFYSIDTLKDNLTKWKAKYSCN
jgi:hypothetical protein